MRAPSTSSLCSTRFQESHGLDQDQLRLVAAQVEPQAVGAGHNDLVRDELADDLVRGRVCKLRRWPSRIPSVSIFRSPRYLATEDRDDPERMILARVGKLHLTPIELAPELGGDALGEQQLGTPLKLAL